MSTYLAHPIQKINIAYCRVWVAIAGQGGPFNDDLGEQIIVPPGPDVESGQTRQASVISASRPGPA